MEDCLNWTRFRKVARDQLWNCCPVALLICLRKKWERCIYGQRLWLIVPILSNAHFGFRSGRSCGFQLFIFLNLFYINLVKKVNTLFLYSDLIEHLTKLAKNLFEKLYWMEVMRYHLFDIDRLSKKSKAANSSRTIPVSMCWCDKWDFPRISYWVTFAFGVSPAW